MPEYKRDRVRVDKLIRKVGVVIVLNKNHVKTPEHMVTTMWEIYQAGYLAECTFRIDTGIITEAMAELTAISKDTKGEIDDVVTSLSLAFRGDDIEGACQLTTRLKYLHKMMGEVRHSRARLLA